jgi:hypothetical protein
MLSRLRLGTAIIDAADQALPAGAQNTPGILAVLPADEFAGSDGFSGTCFEHCSPIRTRCPGPAAQLSVHNDGQWIPVCRRAVT